MQRCFTEAEASGSSTLQLYGAMVLYTAIVWCYSALHCNCMVLWCFTLQLYGAMVQYTAIVWCYGALHCNCMVIWCVTLQLYRAMVLYTAIVAIAFARSQPYQQG